MKFKFVILSCLLFSFVAYGQKGKKKSQDFYPLDVTVLSESDALKVETMLIEAEKELILENYYKAYDLFKSALEISPDNPTLNYKTGEVLSKNGDHQTALAYAKRAMELSPTNKYFLLLAADIHKSLFNYKEAAEVYQQLIDNIPATESYLFDLALIYQYLGEDEKAIETFGRAEDYFGMNEMVLYEKQKIYLKDENYEALIADWDKLIQENKGEARFVIDLCEFLISRGLYDEAKSRLDKLEGNNQADLLLSQIALEQGDTEKAIIMAKTTFKSLDVDFKSKVQLLNSFLDLSITPGDFAQVADLALGLAELYPQQYQVQAFTGDVMFRIEEKEKAAEFYLKAVKLEPTNYGVWQNILSIESELNQYDSVIVHAEEALEYFPNQAIFYYFAGTGYLLEKEYKRSVQLLDQGRKYVTDANLLTVFFGQMGDAYNSMKQYEKAYDAYDQALQSDPENDHVLNNYSYYLSLRNKDLNKALEMSSKLVDLHPDNPTYLDTHGWVLYTMKKYNEALTYLEKAAGIGEDGTIIEHFGDVLFQLGRKEEAIEQWKRASNFADVSENIQKKIAEGKLYE